MCTYLFICITAPGRSFSFFCLCFSRSFCRSRCMQKDDRFSAEHQVRVKQYSSFLPSHAHLSSSHLLYLLNIIPYPLFNSPSPHHTLPTSSLLPFPPLPPSSHPLNIVPPLSLNILLPQPAEVCRYFLNYVLRGVIEPGSRTFLKGDLRIIVQSTLSLAFVTWHSVSDEVQHYTQSYIHTCTVDRENFAVKIILWSRPTAKF